MKAIFKLNNDQVVAAMLLAASVAADADAADLNCGIYAVHMHCATNSNQSVRLVDDTLIIEGERCALAADGGFEAAKSILRAGQKPVEYITSDRRLRWDETLQSFMFSDRATRAEKMGYLEDHPDRWHVCHLFPELWGSIQLVETNYRAACAELDSDTMRLCRRIIYWIR
jgi:hypothetical protein